MEDTSILSKIIAKVEELDEENVIKLTEEALENGLQADVLIDAINEGMLRVGKLYEEKTYFIADLIMAGLIFKEVLELEKMAFYFQVDKNEKAGKVLVGTVKGDLHDIGKDIFRSLMESNRVEVIDLGVDVLSDDFIKKTLEFKPDIIGLSGVLTSTVDEMKKVVNALEKAGVRKDLMIIAGGNHLNQDLCKYIGADSYANDVQTGVKLCLNFLSNKKGGLK